MSIYTHSWFTGRITKHSVHTHMRRINITEYKCYYIDVSLVLACQWCSQQWTEQSSLAQRSFTYFITKERHKFHRNFCSNPFCIRRSYQLRCATFARLAHLTFDVAWNFSDSYFPFQCCKVLRRLLYFGKMYSVCLPAMASHILSLTNSKTQGNVDKILCSGMNEDVNTYAGVYTLCGCVLCEWRRNSSNQITCCLRRRRRKLEYTHTQLFRERYVLCCVCVCSRTPPNATYEYAEEVHRPIDKVKENKLFCWHNNIRSEAQQRRALDCVTHPHRHQHEVKIYKRIIYSGERDSDCFARNSTEKNKSSSLAMSIRFYMVFLRNWMENSYIHRRTKSKR